MPLTPCPVRVWKTGTKSASVLRTHELDKITNESGGKTRVFKTTLTHQKKNKNAINKTDGQQNSDSALKTFELDATFFFCLPLILYDVVQVK